MINVRCPICDRQMDRAVKAKWPEFPFCSKRCRTIDLGRWLGETYAVPDDDRVSDPSDSKDEHSIP